MREEERKMDGTQIGNMAPDFALQGTGGEVQLSGFRGKKAVVLYFYPKDDTPG